VSASEIWRETYKGMAEELGHAVERREKKNIFLLTVKRPKNRQVFGFRDYHCEACRKTFTQCHSLHKHRKYHCKRLETEKKKECPECGKMLSKTTIYSHAKNGCPKSQRVGKSKTI